ncbi:MAG: ion transporter [Carboxylicivirga sp.]|nr:ion transporter [Carboxylicivirga sp.]
MIKRLILNDKFILVLILLNSILLFVSGYETQKANGYYITIVDNLITLIFMAEVIIKVREFGFNNYIKSFWNKLDFILVGLSTPALLTFVFHLQMDDFSFLLIFRIMRIFKTFRFIKFIPNVEHLFSGIQRALKASVFVFVGFAIYIFIIGILSFYLFHESGGHYYKNPVTSLYSTFKIFTVEGWFEIPEEITTHYSTTKAFMTYLYFIFVVITGGIFGLSLVNSIFVDSMVSDNNDDLEAKIDNLEIKINKVLEQLSEQNSNNDADTKEACDL